jgi:hypothetical protein
LTWIYLAASLALTGAYGLSVYRGIVWWNAFSDDTWTPESRSNLNHK